MRIKRITDAVINDISNERVEEMLETLKEIVESMDDNKELLKTMESELSNFLNKNAKKNDQLDDSSLNLNTSLGKIDEVLGLLDTIYTNLEDYNKNGRKYIYG